MGLFLTNKKRNYTSMNNVWSTLLGLVAELNINKKSKREVKDLREESDGEKIWALTIYMEKPESPFGKTNCSRHFRLGRFRKYGLQVI